MFCVCCVCGLCEVRRFEPVSECAVLVLPFCRKHCPLQQQAVAMQFGASNVKFDALKHPLCMETLSGETVCCLFVCVRACVLYGCVCSVSVLLVQCSLCRTVGGSRPFAAARGGDALWDGMEI